MEETIKHYEYVKKFEELILEEDNEIYKIEMMRHLKKIVNIINKIYNDKMENVLNDCILKGTNDDRLDFIEIETFGYIYFHYEKYFDVDHIKKQDVFEYLVISITEINIEQMTKIENAFLRGYNNNEYEFTELEMFKKIKDKKLKRTYIGYKDKYYSGIPVPVIKDNGYNDLCENANYVKWYLKHKTLENVYEEKLHKFYEFVDKNCKVNLFTFARWGYISYDHHNKIGDIIDLSINIFGNEYWGK